ncbi:MAG: double-strand break repair helicase AddA, partial [Halocynthiibacter sp.]
MSRRDMATERQVQAADPRGSVWLSANAGSGKTRVLTDRVARLLLGGVSPQHILCLTYTKAAASEMQNRLFKRLGSWSMQGDHDLRKSLVTLGIEGSIDAAMLARARRLFAGAIETPGGLKIQTIHSFCAALLRRFPLEAGVSPQFTEMDERAARLLHQDIVEKMAAGPGSSTVDGVAQFYTGEDLASLTREVVRHGEGFSARPNAASIWQQFGLPAGMTDADVLAQALTGGEVDLLRSLVPVLLSGGDNDIKAAQKLGAVAATPISLADMPVLEKVFLFGSTAKRPYGAKVDAFPTKATRNKLGALQQPLNEFMERIESARVRRISLYSAQKTLAMHEFASVFLPEYAARKQARGWLDFDDLILKARALLSDPQVAQWVLYRLDGGIDHVLVDEAQDTSPAQWDVIERLVREFTTGQGARAEVERTVFIVGDKKQSIYSFMGADLEGFDRMRAHFGEKLKAARRQFAEMQLEYSFRSAGTLLRLVDTTFQARAGNGLGGGTPHRAFKDQMPGGADLWSVVLAAPKPEKTRWQDPVDIVSQNHHSVVLARQIAEQIDEMLRTGAIPAEQGQSGDFRMRRIRPGDILILVQRRSSLFHEIIKSCKGRGLPVAGADRLKVGAELAVRDLVALLSFLATPEDDLSLAAALRSPLFGWSQQALHRLAQPRAKNEYLWAALRNNTKEHAATLDVLRALRDDSDFLRPYDLIERILTRHNGRRALRARLGLETEDGIDALLQHALAYEQMD